jgi:SAM-dependent methyltransferase
MNSKEETVKTYDRTASQMAEKFRGMGARVEDIDRAFAIINKEHPSVLEIGCGDGRDAKEISSRTNTYLGIDVSTSMIELARVHVPEASFEVADVETYSFPAGLDIIFSFASLLHSDKEAVANILHRAHSSLNDGGIFFISLKRDDYQSKVKEDEFGARTFYFYQPSDIKEILDEKYAVIFEDEQSFQNQDWFTLILQKQ